MKSNDPDPIRRFLLRNREGAISGALVGIFLGLMPAILPRLVSPDLESVLYYPAMALLSLGGKCFQLQCGYEVLPILMWFAVVLDGFIGALIGALIDSWYKPEE